RVVRDGDFVGVTAPTEQAAARALAALRAEWRPTPQPSAAELFRYLRDHPAAGRGFGGRGGNEQGSIRDGLRAAQQGLEATYTIAYIAHVPLEPRAAVAEWADGKVTVWTGTQRPFGVRDELTRALNVPANRVRVIVPDTGSGYGGKHTGEAAGEAARLGRTPRRPRTGGGRGRGGVHLGVLPPGRRHRDQRRGHARRHADRVGVSQLQRGRGGPAHALRGAKPAHRIPRLRLAAAPGLVPRPRGHGEPLRAR